MKKYVYGLLYVDSHDSIVRVFQSWRLWIVGAIIGTLVATAVYAIFPPPFRARAVVVVDQNLEEAWEFGSGQLFYFLGRETRKLQELAWSDDTLQVVADQVGDVSVLELRDQILQLSQPEDGGWYFFADSHDADQAELIASTWAQVFYQHTYQAVEISSELESIRREINQVLERSPDLSEDDVRRLIDKISPTLFQTKGISHFIELDLVQIDDLMIRRSVPLSVYILAGSIVGACSLALAALIFLRAEEKDAFLVE
jgi:hypothetical protein